MKIETVAIVGVVFALTALAALTYDRRIDVLHGPYISKAALQMSRQTNFWSWHQRSSTIFAGKPEA